MCSLEKRAMLQNYEWCNNENSDVPADNGEQLYCVEHQCQWKVLDFINIVFVCILCVNKKLQE